MKAKDFKELTKEELMKKKKGLKEELFNLRFQHTLKKDVARIETVLSEKE